MVAIQDPIHGHIALTQDELSLVDEKAFQRLRNIKQLGFSELSFPGATHTRYAHSLGAMHVAGQIVDQVFEGLALPSDQAALLRLCVRLSVLFHDIGHAPFKPCFEKVMPSVDTLQMPDWLASKGRQATHEDYTLMLLTESKLTDAVSRASAGALSGQDLASLVAGRLSPEVDASLYEFEGKSLLPLLHAIVSGEVDADRMDYLRRDAFYCGVNYGNFDHMWLTTNLTAVPSDNHWQLGLRHRGVWAFENFLLARYHMFLAVYLHHIPVCFDNMLGRYFESGDYTLPSEPNGYLETDDIELTIHLRRSNNLWAKMVAERTPYRLLLERHDYSESPEPQKVEEILKESGVRFFVSKCKSALSKYVGEASSSPILVWEPELNRLSRIQDYTPLYSRFSDVVGIYRIFCHPNDTERARTLLEGC